MDDWRSRFKEVFPHARFDEPLRRHTTFRIGGPADCFLEISGSRGLGDVLRFSRDKKLPFLILGRGSNLLVLDGGFRGIVARLRGEFEKVEFLEGDRVRAGAGVRLPQLISLCSERGLGGAEPLVGVPGTVGGALVMNAGTREAEIGPLVLETRVMDQETGQERVLTGPELSFSYRRSSLVDRLILDCVLQLKAADKVDIIKRIQDHQQRRLRTQPIHTFNVGSIFKNPPGRFVAQLIEEAGLKGFTRGGARVSPLHANFIENARNASAADVLDLIGEIRAKVKAKHGVDLELEIKIVGQALV